MTAGGSPPDPQPGSAPALPSGRCPRCGGTGLPPKRQRTNPFLTTAEPLVCGDCGLEFEQEEEKRPESMPPWQ